MYHRLISLLRTGKKKTEDDEEDEEGDLTEQERFYLQVTCSLTT